MALVVLDQCPGSVGVAETALVGYDQWHPFWRTVGGRTPRILQPIISQRLIITVSLHDGFVRCVDKAVRRRNVVIKSRACGIVGVEGG